MSWTRHLYDPVGAIARDSGIIGGNHRPMTPEQRLLRQTMGNRRFDSDGGQAFGGAGRGYHEREPLMLAEPQEATAMPKPAPVGEPAKAPGVATTAGQRTGLAPGSGVGPSRAANPGVGLSAPAGVAAAAGPYVPQGGFTPAMADNLNRVRNSRPQPLMTADPNAPAPTGGRFARRPFP